MPDSGPNPATSERIIVEGIWIPEDQLPVGRARRIADMGPHMMQAHHKRASDLLDYFLDLQRWLEPSEMIVGAVAEATPTSMIVSALQFADTGVVVWLAGGGDGARQTVELRITTSLGKIRTFRFVVLTRGTNPLRVRVSVEPVYVAVGWSMGEEPGPVEDGGPRARGQLLPPAISFPTTPVNESALPRTVVLTNVGDAILSLRSIRAAGDFSQTNDCGPSLAPGESCNIAVSFKPAVAGARTGSLYVDTADAAGEEYVVLSGEGDAATLEPITYSLSPLTLAFSTPLDVGETSAARTLTLTNTSARQLAISSIEAQGDFTQSNNCGLGLAPGSSCTINVRFAPTKAGAGTGSLLVNTNGDGAASVALSGTAAAVPVPVASIADAEIFTVAPEIPDEPDVPDEPEEPPVAVLELSRTSFNFGEVLEGSPATPAAIVLANTGTARLNIASITAAAPFTQTNNCGTGLAPGASCTINVAYTPGQAGAHAGSLSIATDAGTGTVALAGTGTKAPATGPLPRLSVSGNQFVTPTGTPVRLRTVNWFGAESDNYTPHGTWLRPWREIIDDIKDMGFNCIRMPFSGSFCAPGRMVTPTAVDWSQNADLEGLSALEVLDKYIEYCGEKGLYMVLDHHRRHAGAGADGGPTDGTYSVQNWHASWLVMANRYKDNPVVVGADVHNEPHNHEWNEWATLAEQCGNAILAVAPDWIIFVEGVGHYGDEHYWWGGALQGVRDRPVVLSRPNRLAYSPHEYGQSVGSQSWLGFDGQPLPANYPKNLYAVWRNAWGFIFEQNIAPIWIGEFGGFYGVDGQGKPTKAHGTYERQWTEELAKYLNGDFNGDGTRELAASKLGASFAYWSLNPNSGDTGGLYQDDWITRQTSKLTLINTLLTN